MTRIPRGMRMAAIFLLAGVGSIRGQESGFDRMQGMGDTKYHLLEYEPLEQTYHIFVRLPDEHENGKKYPTVYLLDGGATFPMLGAYYHYLRFAEEIPPAIIVGISYGTDDWQKGNNRSRGFTAKSAERDYWGGAPDFVEFFRKALCPLIENSYAADSARRIVFGQSLGGQFVLFAAQTAPNLFWGHIASNPALHRNLDFFLNTKLDPSATKSPRRLFVSSGADDDARFRGPALKWMQFWNEDDSIPWALKTVTLKGQNHFSAAPEAFRQGLRWIFNTQTSE